MTTGLDASGLRFLRETQNGVLARSQLHEEGLTDNDVARLLRRRELNVVHPGVYVDHTGPLTWPQREWAAVLACSPAARGQDRSRGAALCDESAVPGLTPPTIHVAIGLHRSVLAPAGVELHSNAHLAERVDWRAGPPRMRTDEAVLDVMVKRIAAGDVAGSYAALATACFKATSADRVERALTRRSRVAGRKLVAGMLEDLRTGACSVLERGYLERVERAHGLPRADRQQASDATGTKTVQDSATAHSASSSSSTAAPSTTTPRPGTRTRAGTWPSWRPLRP
jgi:hypothetical protein